MEKQLNEIFSKRGMVPYEHQKRNILNYIEPVKRHVAAAATSAGKTITTAAKFELYYKFGLIKKNEKVLILSADKTILRYNFVEQFDKFFKDVPASFTYRGVSNKMELQEAIEDGVQVIIALPQLINDNTRYFKKLKWLVVDEAHHWYFADTIKKIINNCKPQYQFLLTGSPFKFNLYKNDFIIDYTTVRDLYEQGLVSDINLQVLHTSLALTRLDWISMTDNLRSDKRLSKDDLDKALTEVIEQLIDKLKIPTSLKKHSTINNITNNALKVFGKLEKTIIFTHGTHEASVIGKYLEVCGVSNIVSHSKVENDDADYQFNLFKQDDSIKVLVAVVRGREGFDFPNLYNIIDMTYSKNFEVVIQMVGRLLRKSENKIEKVFYKVAPKNTAGYFTDWMDCLIQLFDEYWYSRFNGRNTMDITVPNALLSRPKPSKTPMFIHQGKKKIQIISGTSLIKGTKVQITDKNNRKVSIADGEYTIPQPPTQENPKPAPIKIKVKKGVIVETPVRRTRNNFRPKPLEPMGFDLSLSFMERNDWFKLNDPLSTVATTTLRKIVYKFTGSINPSRKKGEIFLPFNEAREYMHKQKNVNTQEEFNAWKDRPDFIPAVPGRTYKGEFTTWKDFLGTKIGFTGEYRPIDDCVKYIKSLGVNTNKQWREIRKQPGFTLPPDIPAEPDNVYDDWSWTLVSGNERTNTRGSLIPFDKAKKYAKGVNVTNGTQWKKINHPAGVPKNPVSAYKDEWKGWDDFLGIKKIVLTKKQILDAQKKYTNVTQQAKSVGVPYNVFRARAEELGVFKLMTAAERNRRIAQNRRSNGAEVNAKKVIQYDLNGKKLKVWKSVKIAAETLGLNEGNIRASMHGGRQSTAFGFIWKFKE